ncbi:MAG: enoyl-CoA hydratase/isomerase family protein, partial [Candidatus Thorarchaeota archaeon]
MEKVEVAKKEKIAIIKLIDAEHLNPLNKETAKELSETLESLKDDNDIRCVVITGSGRAFSAGGDIKGFKASIETGTSGKEMDDLLKNLYTIALKLRLYPKPVIAS